MLNQFSYLSRTLWSYQENGLHTDLTLVCEDGSLHTHAAMLAGLFGSFRISFSSREEVPECIFLPDLSMATVQEALKDLYLKCDANRLLNILKPAFVVKLEVEEHEVKDTKCDVTAYSKEEIDHKEEELKQSFSDFNDDNVDNHSDEEITTPRKSANNKILLAKTASEIEGHDNGKGKWKWKVDNERECEHCGDVFPRKSSLLKHMKKEHGYKKGNIFKGKKVIKGETQFTECPYCDKKLKTLKTMNSHLALVHREEVILNHPEIVMATPCKECDEKFFEIYDLDKHSRVVHKKSLRTWTCRICLQLFDTNAAHCKHQKAEHKEALTALGLKMGHKDSQCPYCEKMCKENYLNVHIFNTHKNKRDLHPELEAKLDCAHCDEKFFDNQSRNIHTKVYHTEGGKCDVCSQVFHNDLALLNHQKKHNGETHVCDLCSKTFSTKIQLKYHIQKHNGYNFQDNYKYKCTACKKGKFATEASLEKHILEYHSGKEYMCPHCPSIFSNGDKLRMHEKRNHTEKTFKCNDCESVFSAECYLKQHVDKVHVKPKDKICPHCGEEFDISQYGTYQAHINRHKNIRPFSCEQCGKDFLTAIHLQYHMKKHTLPHECVMCGARKSSTGEMTNHMKQVHHHGEQEKCRFICGFGTWQIATRCRHEKECSLNPMPGAPYTVAMGTASSYTLKKYNASLKD